MKELDMHELSNEEKLVCYNALETVVRADGVAQAKYMVAALGAEMAFAMLIKNGADAMPTEVLNIIYNAYLYMEKCAELN